MKTPSRFYFEVLGIHQSYHSSKNNPSEMKEMESLFKSFLSYMINDPTQQPEEEVMCSKFVETLRSYETPSDMLKGFIEVSKDFVVSTIFEKAKQSREEILKQLREELVSFSRVLIGPMNPLMRYGLKGARLYSILLIEISRSPKFSFDNYYERNIQNFGDDNSSILSSIDNAKYFTEIEPVVVGSILKEIDEVWLSSDSSLQDSNSFTEVEPDKDDPEYWKKKYLNLKNQVIDFLESVKAGDN